MEAAAALVLYIHSVGKGIGRWGLLCQANIFPLSVCIPGFSAYGASCSDMGLGSGTRALCTLSRKEINLKDFTEVFNVLVEMDSSPQGKKHSCVDVMSSVVTNMSDVLHRSNVAAQLIDFFFLSFLV